MSIESALRALSASPAMTASATARCIGSEPRAVFMLITDRLNEARGSLPMHRAVADAVIAGDADGARRALSTLIEAAREDILGALPDYLREEEDAQRGRMADPRA